MRKEFHYETNCVSSTAELIGEMIERSREVKLSTLRRHVAGLDEWAEGMGYARSRREGHGLTLARDWHVSFHRSVYDGVPCYYIVHSAIEHVFTNRRAARDC